MPRDHDGVVVERGIGLLGNHGNGFVHQTGQLTQWVAEVEGAASDDHSSDVDVRNFCNGTFEDGDVVCRGDLAARDKHDEFLERVHIGIDDKDGFIVVGRCNG
jgi:hypothetical protein